ncbi:MAG: formylglycine-generating enzyme family protein, partial [Pseudomonadota bacterium]
FGKDGDHNPGNVSSRSHRFSTEARILEGDLAAKMTVNASEAARRLFDKYRSGAFGVDTDQGEIAREIAEDALTWDALIHTTYFDHQEIASAIAIRAAGRQNSEAIDEAALLTPARRHTGENLLQTFGRFVRGWASGLTGFAVTLTALIGVVMFLTQFLEPIVNKDHLIRAGGVIAPPTDYLAVIEKGADCDICPEMVILPGGTYSMGSPSYELGRVAIEGPIQRIALQPFAVAKFEVTIDEFEIFLRETNYQLNNDCAFFEGNLSWDNPGFTQTNNHPVVCVNWHDANAYIEWLNLRVEGSPYRLLREAEWEYAARAGMTTAFFWGDVSDVNCGYANGVDLTAEKAFKELDLGPGIRFIGGFSQECEDGFVYTAPVGSFAPNSFGLYDMSGNAYEWVEECFSDTLSRQTSKPRPGKADCRRVIRGGSWFSEPRDFRSANRSSSTSNHRSVDVGFRIARTLEP